MQTKEYISSNEQEGESIRVHQSEWKSEAGQTGALDPYVGEQEICRNRPTSEDRSLWTFWIHKLQAQENVRIINKSQYAFSMSRGMHLQRLIEINGNQEPGLGGRSGSVGCRPANRLESMGIRRLVWEGALEPSAEDGWSHLETSGGIWKHLEPSGNI